MKELFSIRQRDTTLRMVIIGCFIMSIIVCGVSLFYANSTIQESKKNVYVLVNNNSLVRAKSTDITNSIDILMKSQINHINSLLYQQVPDNENMNNQLREAITIGDKSVSKIIDALKQNDYYNSILNQQYYTLLNADSIRINYSVEPYQWKYYGKLKIVRKQNVFYRQIETQGLIEDSHQKTQNNERGFLISNMRIAIDKEIQ